MLCLAYATDFVKPRPDLFGFTIATVTYHFQETEESRCQEWTVAIGRAINEAKHLRHSLEASSGHKAALNGVSSMARATRARSATSSSHKDEEDFPVAGREVLECKSTSRNGNATQSKIDDTAFPERARAGGHTTDVDSGQLDSVTPPSFDISNASREQSLRVGTQVITQEVPAGVNKVGNQMNTYFVSEHMQPRQYTDIDIQDICTLLKLQAPRWCKVPRTYVVLRIIGCLDLLDACIDLGFSDYWFPVLEKSLPDILRPSARAAFVEAQSLVMSQSMDLEKGDQGQHCYFRKGESPPFEMKGVLGRGGYGQVDKVLSLISFKEYARKRMLQSTAFRGRKKEDIKQFIAEIEILKCLKHRHVVEFVGIYTDAKYIGLIMTPVADGYLSSYLASATPSTYPELRTIFGCLAAALEFLHEHNVRHKDIKPQNTLVSNGKVLFADFGLSFDFTDATGSTTLSLVNGKTARYCAPEVANHEARNTLSDIWPLGIAFLEMIVTLKGETLQYMDAFLKQRGSEEAFIRLNATVLPELVTQLAAMGQWTDNKALDWTVPMLSVTPKSRPTASTLVGQITSHDDANFCGICCAMPEEEDFSAYTSD